MVGFHQSSAGQPRMPLGMPIPVHQLNSYVMQQANSMVPKSVSTRPSRLKQEVYIILLQAYFTFSNKGYRILIGTLSSCEYFIGFMVE